MAWQSAATAAVALAAVALAGSRGLLSALLGGGVGVVGVIVFALVSSRPASSPEATVRLVIRAEAARLTAIVLLLWLVFALYRDLMVLPFIGAFMIAVLLSGIAFAVSGD